MLDAAKYADGSASFRLRRRARGLAPAEPRETSRCGRAHRPQKGHGHVDFPETTSCAATDSLLAYGSAEGSILAAGSVIAEKLRDPRASVLPRRSSSLTLSVMLEGMRGRRAGFRVTRTGYVVHVDFREVLEWLHGEVGEWRAPMALGFSVRRGTGGTVNLRV
jgi:hypothetical protein